MRWICLLVVLLSLQAEAQRRRIVPYLATAGGEPTTVWDTVSADNHDAMSDPGNENLVYPTTVYTILATSYDPGPSMVGFIWPASVPQGATLDSAIVELFIGAFDHVAAESASVFAYNVDNVGVFDGAHTHELDAHATLTTDSVVVTIPSTDFVTLRTPNLAALLQTVVNRVGYAQGNNIGIILRVYPEWPGGEFHNFHNHEDSANPDRWARIKWVYQ